MCHGEGCRANRGLTLAEGKVEQVRCTFAALGADKVRLARTIARRGAARRADRTGFVALALDALGIAG